MYTVASSTTTVVLGLVLSNINTTAVTAEVELVSTTSSRGGAKLRVDRKMQVRNRSYGQAQRFLQNEEYLGDDDLNIFRRFHYL